MDVLTREQLAELHVPLAVAIGFFDGVHIGHQQVIVAAVEAAKRRQTKSVVITFHQSPKIILGRTSHLGYLTPLPEKLRQFEALGVDYVLVLQFDETLLCLPPKAFIEDYLVHIGAEYVSVGFDFRFGHLGSGSADDLIKSAKFDVNVVPPIETNAQKVSTSDIKKYMEAGGIERINALLARRFTLSGTVLHGKKMGRTIGYPTANIAVSPDYLMTLRGVYATLTEVKGKLYKSMTNIGHNPTMNHQKDVSVETHLLDFNGDLYDQPIRLEFITKIRDEKKFTDLEALKHALAADKKFVENLTINV